MLEIHGVPMLKILFALLFSSALFSLEPTMDPQSRQLLDKINSMGPLLIDAQPVEISREQTESFFPSSQAPISSSKDVSIPGPHGPIPLRIYSPCGVGPFPVLVYFHGGGWVLGSLNSVDALMREITASSKAIVVSVGYRLAPENKFPIAVNDAYATVLWVKENIEKYKGRPSKLIVGGESAGGNLAAAVTLLAREKKEPEIQGQILICPVTRFAYYSDSYKKYGKGYFVTQDMMQWFWKQYLSDPEEGKNFLASPLFAKDLSHLPPALILLAHFDPLHDEGYEYAHRLKECDVPVKLVEYLTFHGFINLLDLDLSKKAIQEIAAFIDLPSR